MRPFGEKQVSHCLMDHMDSVTTSMSPADVSWEVKGKICNGKDHLPGLNKVTALGLRRFSEKMDQP